jgi:hypothetical protein
LHDASTVLHLVELVFLLAQFCVLGSGGVAKRENKTK